MTHQCNSCSSMLLDLSKCHDMRQATSLTAAVRGSLLGVGTLISARLEGARSPAFQRAHCVVVTCTVTSGEGTMESPPPLLVCNLLHCRPDRQVRLLCTVPWHGMSLPPACV